MRDPLGVTPEFAPEVGLVGVARCADVVCQRVEPHVDDLLRVAGYWYSPTARTLGAARYGQVGQRIGEKRQDLVFPVRGADAQPVGLDQLDQLILIAAEPEEVVGFRHPLRRSQVFRADAVGELRRRIELFAANAIQSLIPRRVDVARVGARMPQLVDRWQMARIRTRADEIVVRYRKLRGERLDPICVVTDQRLGRDAARFGCQRILQAVVVGARQQPDLETALPRVTCEHVGDHQFQRKPDVRWRVHVRNGRRDESVVRHEVLLPGFSGAKKSRATRWGGPACLVRPTCGQFTRSSAERHPHGLAMDMSPDITMCEAIRVMPRMVGVCGSVVDDTGSRSARFFGRQFRPIGWPSANAAAANRSPMRTYPSAFGCRSSGRSPASASPNSCSPSR